MKTQSDYYPYGEVWLEPEGQPWLYSGNERLREDGINEYDFNARRYNSALGLFTTWDPLAEKRPWDSPYAFCAGDPVNHSDPTGKEWKFEYEDGIGTIKLDLILRAEGNFTQAQLLELQSSISQQFSKMIQEASANTCTSKIVFHPAGAKFEQCLVLYDTYNANGIIGGTIGFFSGVNCLASDGTL